MGKLAKKLALDRPELRAWAMYDWANSPFMAIVITAVFPSFFAKFANAGGSATLATERLATTTAIALALVALVAPILGAIADTTPSKKKFLAAAMCLGAGSTAAFVFIGEGDWVLAAVLFGLANVGASASFVFYDSLLPHIAKADELDRVSTAGYAFGYLGGGILLGISIALILNSDAVGLSSVAAIKVSFVAVAVWWLVFSIPLFRRVPEPPISGTSPSGVGRTIAKSFSNLAETFRELKRYRQALLLLIAFLVYNDGIGTITRMAVIYGEAVGLETADLIIAVLITQFIGIPCTFMFGAAASRVGARKAIFVGLGIYAIISILGYFMTTALHFYLLAALVGLVQGGVQALSRSLFASMIPSFKSTEFFGLFAVFEKFAGIFGPALFAFLIVVSGDARTAILGVIGFFIVGAALLTRVNVAEGRTAARKAEAEAEAERSVTG